MESPFAGDHGRSQDFDLRVETHGDQPVFDRRTFLAALGTTAGITTVSGCSTFEGEENAGTASLSDERARELAERFAPTLYFDEHERWFPTDPRPYEGEDEDEIVVDGFTALDDYTNRFAETDVPPEPTVFYHAIAYEDSPLAVVQFWYYSVFDQFTTNFHWHDWEVLHVFVDTETGDPQLYVASSHSGSVPNNEYLDPVSDQEPRILSELGSHSSALSVNDVADRFQRLPIDGTIADITNSAIESLGDVSNIPFAYGLPRDEGGRLPYVVPELEAAPLYDHERLPSVDIEDLVSEELTIRSFADLRSPPGDLPGRSTGLQFQYAGRDGDADVAYDLVSTSDVEHITDFTGPQLSFEFAVPAFAEDAIASHITSTGVPWDQPRYEDPVADISDSFHQSTLAGRYDAVGEPASINTVLAQVTQAISSEDAPADEGLRTDSLGVESFALLESTPEAVPTFNGLAAVTDVPAGTHRLTVNGPGVQPHSEAVAVDQDGTEPTRAGVDGEIPMVAREESVKLEVNTEQTETDLTALALEDDFAGRLYDAPLDGPDAVYVHRGGAYTTEVRDADDELGAYRINPNDETGIRLDEPTTGKESLSTYLATVADETAAAVTETSTAGGGTGNGDKQESPGGQENAVQGLATALLAVADAARRAADNASKGNSENADRNLNTVSERLERVQTRLADAADSMPNDLERAVGHRLDQSRKRADQAVAATKL